MESRDTLITHAVTGRELLDELAGRFTLVETDSEVPEQANRRTIMRHELQAGVVEVNVTYSDGSEAPALLTDVSTEGARLVAERLPSCAQVVRLSFNLGDRCLVLDGEVEHAGDDDAIRHFGVRFTDTPVGQAGQTPAGPAPDSPA